MTSLWLAWRMTRRYRVRAALAVVGVAVIGALLFDMLLLSRGLLDSFADLLRSGGFDVRVVADEGIPFARSPIAGSARLAADLRALPEVGQVVLIRIARGRAQVDGQPPAGVTLIGTSDTGGSGWTMVKGDHLPSQWSPADGCAVVISRPLAAELDAGPGSRIRISARLEGIRSALPTTECRVSGVANFAFAPTNEYAVATAMTTLQDALGSTESPEADLVLVASRPDAGSAAAVRAIKRIRPDLRTYSNDDVVAQFNQNGFAYFRQISLVLSSLTMVFAFLLVATLLTVSVNQRLGEIAALRALGIGRARIASLLLWESALLVGGGALLALPLGGVLAMALDRLLREMPGLPERLHFFVFQWRAVALHVALFAATAAAAAAYPVWLTSRLPIAATLRREVVG